MSCRNSPDGAGVVQRGGESCGDDLRLLRRVGPVPLEREHCRRDPFFPVGNGEALAREITGARLLVLERAATAIPDAAAADVAAAMLAL